jgi:hypothetical protein
MRRQPLRTIRKKSNREFTIDKATLVHIASNHDDGPFGAAAETMLLSIRMIRTGFVFMADPCGLELAFGLNW